MQTELSHTIYQGVCDYSHLHSDWELFLTPIESILSYDIANWEIDGMIASLSQNRYEKLKGANYPLVSTLCIETLPDTLPQVDEDHVQTGIMAADHLQNLGHEHFACIYVERLAHRSRAESFAQRLEENGQSVSVLGIPRPGLSGSRTEEVEQWLKDLPKPVALFAADDHTARGVLSRCRDHHLAVPDDVAILSCENDKSLCRGVTPALSSIQLPYHRIGYEAARLLDLLMQRKSNKAEQILFAPEQVVTRASTNTLAIPDPHLRKAIRYIRSHIDERIEVSEAAAAAGISLRSLQRRFKEELSRTPVEELHRAKIERIKELLISTNLTLNEIAEKTSFSAEYYMGALFKRYTHQTPGQYRKKHRHR